MPGKLGVFLTLALIFAMSSMAPAEMIGTGYRIPSSVFSAGGEPSSSIHFQMNGTLGQSSPLVEGSGHSSSENYRCYPGFWHPARLTACPWDMDGDEDVDGVDLALFSEEYGRSGCDPITSPCKGDFNNDGSVDETDLAGLALSFGRTGCL